MKKYIELVYLTHALEKLRIDAFFCFINRYALDYNACLILGSLNCLFKRRLYTQSSNIQLPEPILFQIVGISDWKIRVLLYAKCTVLYTNYYFILD